MINSSLYAEEQIPDFPYDPEERATEMKRCASVCISCLLYTSDADDEG